MPKEIPKPSVLGGRLSAIPVALPQANAAKTEPKAPPVEKQFQGSQEASSPRKLQDVSEIWTKVTLEVPAELAEQYRDAAWALRTKYRAKDLASAFFEAGLELLRNQENRGKPFPNRPSQESLRGGRALKLKLS